MKVLVVDDHGDTRDMMIELARLHGADAIGASSVDEALATLERVDDVDLVVTDWRMPGGDGGALVRALAGDARRRSIRCVLVSGQVEGRMVRDVLGDGSVIFMRKPIDPAAFGVVLRRASIARLAPATEEDHTKARTPAAIVEGELRLR